MKYRWGRENDLPQIIGLLNLVKGDQRNLIADQFLIASDNKKIVGCIRILEQQGMRQLISFGVLPEHRRKRIGSALMKKLLKVKSQRPIYLLCFKDLENFYNQFGFIISDSQILPTLLKKEYKRVFSKFSEIKKEIIAMKLS